MEPLRCRSDAYQNVFYEVAVDPFILAVLQEKKQEENEFNSDEVLEMFDKLQAYVIRRLPDLLTRRQMNMVELALQGHNQLDIARILKCSQGAVSSILRNGPHLTITPKEGGMAKRVRRLLRKDPEFLKMVAEIQEALEVEKVFSRF